MKLHLSGGTARNAFTGYGAGYVLVNGTRYTRSLIVLPERIITDWQATTFEALEPAHFATFTELGVEIVLLGTGDVLRFPQPELIRPVIDARLGLEVMDLQAACRTYNILVDEGRRVAAALLFG